jgi:hypothetical protein
MNASTLCGSRWPSQVPLLLEKVGRKSITGHRGGTRSWSSAPFLGNCPTPGLLLPIAAVVFLPTPAPCAGLCAARGLTKAQKRVPTLRLAPDMGARGNATPPTTGIGPGALQGPRARGRRLVCVWSLGHLPPTKGERCNPCVRYEVSPMIQAAHS